MRALTMSAVAVALLTGPACSKNYVKVDAMALGRVIVYRNGVAFFERRARLDGDELIMKVPHDKVDDFLKSLTVKDASTDKTLPISFPSAGGNTYGGMVEMKIKLPKGKYTDLVITYITEAPAWKPSYRVIVGDNGTVELQTWAIVDNTSGEDWEDVLIGVGSSSALSFRYDLWSIRSVHREKLTSQDRFAVAPPRGDATYTEQQNTRLLTTLTDDDIIAPNTHPNGVAYGSGSAGGMAESYPEVLAKESASSIDQGASISATASAGDMRKANMMQKRLEASRRKVKNIAQSLKANRNMIIIEGYSRVGEANASARALDRANMFRNQLIENGVPPAKLTVRVSDKSDPGKGGVRLVEQELADPEHGGLVAEMPDTPVGESHFESKTPLTVKRGSSVMVSIVHTKTAGEVVYLYDAESERGNDRYAFKAIRLVNPTNSTLEAGPVTVYGDGRFIGEGLTEPIPPQSPALIPFALDRQIVVVRTHKSKDRIARLVSLQRGVLTTEVSHERHTELKLTNRMKRDATVYVRHTIGDGWKLEDSPSRVEKIGKAHLFPVHLKGNETKTIKIVESTPLTKTLDLRSTTVLSMVKLYLSAPAGNGKFADEMKAILAINKEMADHQLVILSLRERMGDYRVRMDELHAQILTLKLVKTGGPLMKHLKRKMKEISDRVQTATIDLVNREEKLMLARIRFQDAIAELTLDEKVATR